jgi:hypothetical protein
MKYAYLGNEHWKLEAGELEAKIRSWNAESRKLEGKLK